MSSSKGWLTSRRLAVVGLPLLALITGTALPPTASLALAPHLAGRYSMACPAGRLAEADALSRAGAAAACAAAGGPESVADVASLQHQLIAREAAPFSRTAPGAYNAGVAQAAAVLPAGTYPGSGGTWKPAGATPDCDGQTTQSQVCPLANNSNCCTASNGDYTISLLGHKELSGRVTSFATDPANAAHLWLSAAGGGVFESLDSGDHWVSVGDGLPTQVIGAIAYSAPTHTLLAGSGDNAFGGDSISGHGIYYTTDDGAHWLNSAGIPDLALSFRIVVSPADPTGRTIYAAMSRGLFKSTDAGRTYVNERLPTSPDGYTVPDPTQHNAQVSCQGNVTAPLCFFANIVTDVVVKGSSSTNAPAGAVMAVVGWRAGQKVDKDAAGANVTTCNQAGVATNCLQAPRNGLYLSGSGAPGTFAFQSHAGSQTEMDFAPDNVVGRTSLGIASGAGQNNDAVFAMVQDAQKFQHCTGDTLDVPASNRCVAALQELGQATYLDGIYETQDFGAHWVKVLNWSQLHFASGALTGVPGYSPGVQSWYNNWIQPDPTRSDANHNPTRLVFGLEEVWENNVNLPQQGPAGVLDTPWSAYATNTGAAAAWVDIGRYWNDCGGLNQTGGIPCDTTGIPAALPPTTTHPDQHASAFVPDGSGGVTLFVGNDGGAYRQHTDGSTDLSNQNWGDGIDVGLYTLQPYDAVASQDGHIVAGLQDNGETIIAPGGTEQHTIFGGDGFFTFIDPTFTSTANQNIVEEYTYGTNSISVNGGKDWYNITNGNNYYTPCNSSEAQFSTVLELDTSTPGHAVEGCTLIQEAGAGASLSPTDPNASAPQTSVPPATTAHTTNPVFANPCVAPPGADPYTCQVLQSPWTNVYDLGTTDAPGMPADRTNACNPQVGGCNFNIPSAMSVQDENMYAAYCGYCDVVTGGLPFNSGIATNVGYTTPPKIGYPDGWHIATANCAGCGASDGKLPKRLITSIQSDPANPRTVYVTLGGYGRHWIPPGALGDDVSKVGSGHVFVSRDAGENFTDISGNLPDVPANYTLVHNGQLVVATDIGTYIAGTLSGGTYSHLGTGLPNVPVFTVRLQPGHPDTMIAATYGRGVYKYNFGTTVPVSSSPSPVTAPSANPSPSQAPLPNTAAAHFIPPTLLLLGILLALAGGALIATRQPKSLADLSERWF